MPRTFDNVRFDPNGPHNGFDQRLAEYRELPTNDRGLFGFDKRLGPQVDVGVMRENADTGEYDRAQKTNDHDFQMCSPVAGMQRVVHDGFCSRSETSNRSVAHAAYAAQTKGRFACNNSGIILRLESTCGSPQIPHLVVRERHGPAPAVAASWVSWRRMSAVLIVFCLRAT
jgi:hypothetical protein